MTASRLHPRTQRSCQSGHHRLIIRDRLGEVDYDKRVARELKYHEALCDFLARHLEAARIDEAKNAVVVQVVDRAVEPERKSSPKRLLIVAITAALAFVLA